jgi:hypothetical protein
MKMFYNDLLGDDRPFSPSAFILGLVLSGKRDRRTPSSQVEQ